MKKVMHISERKTRDIVHFFSLDFEAKKTAALRTYTPFNKVSSVQHAQGNNDRYEIWYGLDRQRVKTTYYVNDDEKRYDRYYFGTYEKEVDKNGNVTHIDYIYTPVGLTAIRKHRYSTADYYLVNTDNMGSVQLITTLRGATVASEYVYGAWGGRTLVGGHGNVTSRGYTGHEHLDSLGLINMNGRIYDPTLARFLSPDPYVQAPDFTQSFNRYAYCWNNPFKYTDPTGEFIHLIIGAAIGGTINLLFNLNNIDNFWQGLAYFGVGAAAGALGAGVGAGISSAIAGGSFGAGFIGSSAAMTASSSFIIGAAIGSGAGFAGGFTTGFGNGLLGGQSFGEALWSGTKGGLIGGASGALIGGLVGGISAYKDGRGFWDGFDYQEALDNAVAQEGLNNSNSKWLVANKKNAQLVNETYKSKNIPKVTKVIGNKIYKPNGVDYSEYGINFGSQSKGNITLISKQVIRNKVSANLIDVIRHESTHQVQILAGQRASTIAEELAMEYAAYMTNIRNPATYTTIQNTVNILVNDWGINYSTLWETILNLYPNGPIP